MLREMFDVGRIPEVVVRTAAVYVGLLLAMRLAGKREVGQMKPFDLVTLLILSNAVQNAMVGPDTSLLGGLVAAAVILLLNAAVGRLRERFPLAQDVFEGSPALLVHDGHFVLENIREEHVAEADVYQAMREHGMEDLDKVQSAVLEVDGTISIVPKDDAVVHRSARRYRRQQHN
jgi:uncharacterized membrane protein YcaP (DUF421 family)